jgi:hypothetical protein
MHSLEDNPGKNGSVSNGEGDTIRVHGNGFAICSMNGNAVEGIDPSGGAQHLRK